MIPVRYVDNHLLVIEKPAGWLSQADRTGDMDVLSEMKSWVGACFNKPGNVYLGLVHRLDRPASGLMVLARTSKAAARLTDQLKHRTVEKQYLAWVEGEAPERAQWEDHLIKENGHVRVVNASKPGAKSASLEMTRVSFHNGTSLLSIRLHTGRPHQVRVQCASRGLPLVGDMRYGATSELDGRNLALHAAALAVDHPTRKTRMGWTSQLPDSWPEVIRVAASSWLDDWKTGRGYPDDLPQLPAGS